MRKISPEILNGFCSVLKEKGSFKGEEAAKVRDGKLQKGPLGKGSHWSWELKATIIS